MTSRIRPSRSFGERELPSMDTVPRSSFSSPQHRRDRVVFPAPFSPMTPTTSPDRAEKFRGPMVRERCGADPALLVERRDPYENVRPFASKTVPSRFGGNCSWMGMARSADSSLKLLRPMQASERSSRDSALAASYTLAMAPSSMTTIRSMRPDR